MTDSQPRPSPVPLARRIGIVLAVLLACVAIPAAFGLLPDRATTTTSAFRTAAITILTAASLATIALALPTWRGRRTATSGLAALQLLAAIPFLTVQVLPPNLAPPSSVLAAAGMVVLYAAAATLVTLGVPPIVRHTAALTTAISLFSTIMVTISPRLSPEWMRAVSTLAAAASAVTFLLLAKGLHRFAGRRTRGLPDHANSFSLGGRTKKLATGAASAPDAKTNPATQALADPNPTPRSVAYQLLHGPRPPELDHPGLWRTTERLASHNNSVLTLPDARPPLTAETELAIYAIITSAIANIRRHAPHATLSVSFGFTPTHVNLAVRNSLPPGTNIDATRDTSDAIGLASMLALAEELGGTAALRATPIE
ncbi:sensor histidine kinase [Timonella senegalensis]|uniref:sensor histidine kinase n=1 Tax=Timonella senegalensis TaxID=1465825 RepID=UPI0028A740AF|nr:hypothetical protein [Timonella senegalensis]